MKKKRILLKLSGEALAGNQTSGIAFSALEHYATEIKRAHEQKIDIAIIIGGGNIWRGKQQKQLKIRKVQADQMGMMATMINAIALYSRLESLGLSVRLMSRLSIPSICEFYNVTKAKHHIGKERIVVIGGGTSNPCFTTDSAGCLTAIELETDLFIKGSNVEGIYSDDPKENPNATCYDRLPLQQALDQDLKVMDKTALMLSLNHQLPVVVYNATKKGRLNQVLFEERGGSFLTV